MDIVIGRTDCVNRDRAGKEVPAHNVKSRKREDRRKNKQDRRKSIRDGVIVTLSTRNDRRLHRDRRRRNPDS